MGHGHTHRGAGGHRRGRRKDRHGGEGVSSLEAAALVAAGTAATEGAVEREVDVLLAVHAHQERRHVHDLLAHPAAQAHSHCRPDVPEVLTSGVRTFSRVQRQKHERTLSSGRFAEMLWVPNHGSCRTARQCEGDMAGFPICETQAGNPTA